VPLLAREDIGEFVKAAASAPVAGDAQAPVLDALKRLSSPADDAQIVAALGSDAALRNVPQEVSLALPLKLLQAAWRGVPTRAALDIAYLLQLFDLDVVGAAKAYALGDLSVRPRAASVREAAIARRRSMPVKTLFTIAQGAPDLYARVSSAISDSFEATLDVKWATLRADLFLMHQDPDFSGMGRMGAGAGAGAARAAAAAVLPYDPLCAVYLEAEKLLITDRGSMEGLLGAVRALLERRGGGAFAAAGAGGLYHRGRTLQELLTHVADRLFQAAPQIKHAGIGMTAAIYQRPIIEQWRNLELLYPAAVARPIDLGMIAQRAAEGRYASFEALRADVALLEANSRMFNKLDDVTSRGYHALARRVADKFDELVAELRAPAAEAVPPAVAATASAAPARAGPVLSDTGVAQLLLALTDPFLVRQALHVALRGLSTAVREGTGLEDNAEAVAAIRVLAAGDLAFARPGSPDAKEPPAMRSVAFYDGIVGMLRELLGSGGGTADGRSSPTFPLYLTTALAVAQRALMEYTLLRAGQSLPDGAEASLVPAEGHVSKRARMDGGASYTALRSLSLLQCSRSVHGRTLSLLCVAIAAGGSDPPLPQSQAAVEYMLQLASTALPGCADAGAGAVAQAVRPTDPCLLPTILPATLRCLLALHRARGREGSGEAADSSALLSSAALVESVIERLVFPALAGVRDVAAGRAVAHFAVGQFLRTIVELPGAASERAWQKVLPPFATATVVHRALILAAPDVASPAVVAAGAAWPRALPGLLAASFVQPLTLVWIRPDFAAARQGYCSLLSLIAPYMGLVPFDWGGLGLSPQASGGTGPGTVATALPTSTPLMGEVMYTPITPGLIGFPTPLSEASDAAMG
jgi:hypothetical protein